MSTYQIAQRADTLNLVDVLRQRAQHQPERLAFTFLQRASVEESQITYEELDLQARTIGAILQRKGAAGKPVLLLHPPGLEYVAAFFGCLYAKAIAVPAYPPHSARMLPRIQAIITDTQANIVLTTKETLTSIQSNLALRPALEQLEWIATDTLDSRLSDLWQEPMIQATDLAFLQYTSGSTDVPKGVMVAHSNLIHNLAMISRQCGQTSEGHCVSWLPPYHDLGLICGILYPCYEGFPATLMAPVTFLQRPFLWLQAMSTHKATLSMAPSFAYELCCRKVTPEQRATLDLSHWEVAANGGEPVRSDTLQRFTSTFGPCGYSSTTHFPGYGMAETTLIVATSYAKAPFISAAFSEHELQQGRAVEVSPQEQGARTIIGYPHMSPDQQVIVVDPETRLQCAPGKIGEIWAAGPSVTKGYWRNPEDTEKTFHAYTVDPKQGPFLRTGDLGFLKDDALFVAGRTKDLLIIRGLNHYPQDIELTVERSHRAIRPGCCAAFSIEADENEQLVVLAEIDPRYRATVGATTADAEENTQRKSLDPQEVVTAIRAAIAEEHDLQIYRVLLLKAGGVLKTSSGKLQRRASRAEFLAERLEFWNEE
ncbi:MAG: fatty acyl-AMP ligase [Ktedonobacteraceae bacterium]